MTVEQEIRQAVDGYYEALGRALNGDAGPMLELWSHGMEVSAMHPAGGRQLGWEEVREAWEEWARSVVGGRIEPVDVAIRLVTPDVAYVTGVERGRGTLGPETIAVETRATLVFRREGREWKVVHNHLDVIPALQAAVARAMAAAAPLPA